MNGYQQSNGHNWREVAQGQLGINDFWDPNTGLSFFSKLGTFSGHQRAWSRWPTFGARLWRYCTRHLCVFSDLQCGGGWTHAAGAAKSYDFDVAAWGFFFRSAAFQQAFAMWQQKMKKVARHHQPGQPVNHGQHGLQLKSPQRGGKRG